MNKLVKVAIAFATLFLVLAFSNEDQFFRNMQINLNRFYEAKRPVKIHCTFNQPIYAPGDTAFFNMSFFELNTRTFIAGRQIINVDLVDASGTVILQQKAVVVDGFGANQIALPLTITPGAYTFVAFSDWMKNQDSTLFFHHHIVVQGTKQLASKPDQGVKFYPEGGLLIAGVVNKIVVTGMPGADVLINNSAGNEMARCMIDDAGFGVMYFNPQQNEKYSCNKGQLPPAWNTGVAITTTRNVNGDIKVTLTTSEDITRNYYVVASLENHIYHGERITLNPEQRVAVLEIPAAKVPEGLSLITILDEQKNVVQTRLFYTAPSRTSKIEIITPKSTATREKVTIRLKVSDALGNPRQARIAVTVFSDSLMKYQTTGSIYKAVDLSSNLAFNAVDVPSFAVLGEDALDNFLITQRWKRFNWNDVFHEPSPSKYLFKKNVYLTGKVVATREGLSLPDSSLVTFFFQKNVMTYQSYVRADGKFNFPLLADFYNHDYIYYRIEKNGKRVDGFKIESEKTGSYSVNFQSYQEMEAYDAYGALQSKRKVIDAAYSYSKDASAYQKNADQPHALLEEEIFGVDHEIQMQDYLVFPTMEEVIREIIPMVQHRRVNGKNVVKVYLNDIEMLAAHQPVYMIDGVMTEDTDYFMSIKPENVKVIKVVNSTSKLYAFGTIGKNGLILVETKISNNNANVPRTAYTFTANGVNEAKPFGKIIPVQGNRPYLQTALLWEPHVVTDANGVAELTFYTSDVTGNFRVAAEGFTLQGQPVSGTDTFKVVYQP